MEREGGGREDGAADINLLTKGDWGHWIQSGLPAASQLFWPRYDRPAVNGFTVCNSNLISGYHALSGEGSFWFSLSLYCSFFISLMFNVYLHA